MPSSHPRPVRPHPARRAEAIPDRRGKPPEGHSGVLGAGLGLVAVVTISTAKDRPPSWTPPGAGGPSPAPS
ncbi:hypothetical protein [Streptosporangium sp. NPDC003464]